MDNRTNINIGVLPPILSPANVAPLKNLVRIASSCGSTTVIEVLGPRLADSIDFKSDRVRIHTIRHRTCSGHLKKIAYLIWTHIRLAVAIAKQSHCTDLWIFYMTETMILPLIITKVLRKPVMVVLGNFLESEVEAEYGPLGRILPPMKRLGLAMANRVIVYSDNVLARWNLSSYSGKASVAHEHTIDTMKFHPGDSLTEREKIVGFIGRFSHEKGVVNFLESIPIVHERVPDCRFVIAGEGIYGTHIEKRIGELGLEDIVELRGWTSHDDLPQLLQHIRLLVIPSYTEGLPNIMLEAMACGTLILATPVGAVPDFVVDERTGFILKGNSPNDIAGGIVRVLNAPNPDHLACTAMNLIGKEFTLRYNLENWRAVFATSMGRH